MKEIGNGVKEYVMAIMNERDKRYEEHFVALEEKLKRQITVIGLFSAMAGVAVGVFLGHLLK